MWFVEAIFKAVGLGFGSLLGTAIAFSMVMTGKKDRSEITNSQWFLLVILVAWLVALPFQRHVFDYVLSTCLWLGLGLMGWGYFFGDKSDLVRGTSITDAKGAKKILGKGDGRIEIGGVPVPIELEPLGFLLVGSPGSGKSQAINAITRTVRERGQAAIVADPGSSLLQAYFEPARDVILAPFDARSVEWSPLAEVQGPHDFARLARAIVGDADGPAGEWNAYGQGLVSAVLQRVYETGGTNGDLIDALLTYDDKQLGALVAGTAAARLFGKGAEKMLASVRGIVGSYLEPWQYLPRGAGAKSFSIRGWVESDPSGWLFMPYRADERPLMRPLLAAWLDLASAGTLALQPKRDRRIWLVVDELPALRRISSLAETLAEGRKFGLSCIAGLQTLAQLRDTYGHDMAQALLACWQNILVLRTRDAETADYYSRTLGEQEIDRERTSRTTGTSEGGESTSETTSLERVLQRAVLPAELQQLPDMTGIFDLAGPIPAVVVNLELIELPTVAPARVPVQIKPTAPPAPAAASFEPPSL